MNKVGPIAIQVSRIRRQLPGCAHLVTDQVNNIQVVRQPYEVAVVGIVAGTTTAVEVVHIRRPGDKAKVEVISAQSDALRAVARRQIER